MAKPKPSRWKSIIPLLRKFEEYLHSDTQPLEIVEAWEPEISQEDYAQRQKSLYGRKGVYLLFDAQERPQYVGLALHGYGFCRRIWSHPDIKMQWADVIPFDEQLCFLAPALECFLIASLQLPGNKTYRNLVIGE